MDAYGYCINNPIRYIDPTGMIWEDPQAAEELKTKIREKTTELQTKINRCNNKLNREGISERRANKLREKINDATGRIESLNNSIVNIDLIQSDTQNTYRLVKHSGESSHVTRGSDGVINIQGTSDGIFIHEIKHVAMSINSSNGLVFNNNYLVPTTQDGLTDEMEGYKAQYAYDGGGLPFNVSNINDFNTQSGEARLNMMLKIGGITKEDGNPVYRALQRRASNYREQQRINRRHQRDEERRLRRLNRN